MPVRVALTIIAAAMLAGCSFQTNLDRIVSPARQDHLAMMAKRICKDPSSVRAIFAAEFAASFDQAATKLAQECPSGNATWQVTSYTWQQNNTDGVIERVENVTVVAHRKDRWTTVALRFLQRGNKVPLVVELRVAGSTTPPPSLRYIEDYDNNARFLRVAGFVMVMLLIFVVVGFIVWRRAKLNREIWR